MEFDDLYKFHKDYIQHEDNLTNQRLSWLLAISSILLTIEAALLGIVFVLKSGRYAVSDIVFDLSSQNCVLALAGVTALCGSLLSAAALMAIWGAATAIDGAFDKFYELVGPPESFPNTPKLTHGFGKVQKPRHLYPMAVAATIGVAWAMAVGLILLIATSSITLMTNGG